MMIELTSNADNTAARGVRELAGLHAKKIKLQVEPLLGIRSSLTFSFYAPNDAPFMEEFIAFP